VLRKRPPAVAAQGDVPSEILALVLERLTRVLREVGVTRADLDRAFRAAQSRRRRPEPNYSMLQDLAESVVDRWHTDPDFLLDGRPAALQATGRGRSVDSLIALSVPSAHRTVVRRMLAESPSITKSVDGSTWTCTDRVYRLRGPARASNLANMVEIALRAALSLGGIAPTSFKPLHLQVDRKSVPDALFEPFRARASELLRPTLNDLDKWLESADDNAKTSSTSQGRVNLLTLVHVLPPKRKARARPLAKRRE
jgi:hypothetical protein